MVSTLIYTIHANTHIYFTVLPLQLSIAHGHVWPPFALDELAMAELHWELSCKDMRQARSSLECLEHVDAWYLSAASTLQLNMSPLLCQWGPLASVLVLFLLLASQHKLRFNRLTPYHWYTNVRDGLGPIVEWFKSSTRQQHVIEQYVMLTDWSTRTVRVSCNEERTGQWSSTPIYSNHGCLSGNSQRLYREWLLPS